MKRFLVWFRSLFMKSKPPYHGPPPDGIVIWTVPLSLAIGQHVHLSAVIYNKKGDIMPGLTPSSWQSDNTAVATVDNAGLVTAVGVGSCGVTALLDKLTSNVVAVTVVAAPPTSITVTPGSLNLTVGQTAQLTAVVA